MRNIRILAVVALLAVVAVAAAPKEKEPLTRNLAGFVYGQGDTPLPGAVVYLKNAKTLAMKTLYADDQGGYHFSALSPNQDYEIFAEYKGKHSDTKTLSSFDSRPDARINLHIDIAK